MSITKRAQAIWGGNSDHPYEERPPLPKNLMVEITNACNHACVFCANPVMERKVGRIDDQLMLSIMQQGAAGGCEEIGFYTTGEPLVHKGLELFTRQAEELGYKYIYISTNGGVAGPERMIALVDAGMNSIKFSINAGSRESYQRIHGKDDWDKVFGNMRALRDYREKTNVDFALYASCIVTRQMEHEVPGLLALLEPLVDEVHVVPCKNQSGNMVAAQPLLSPQGENDGHNDDAICPLPFSRLHVTREGYLTLCCVDYQNYLAVADLNKVGLEEAWSCDAFVDARRRHLQRDLKGTLCGNCWYGRTDNISALDENLASKVNFVDFYSKQEESVKNRI